MSIQHGRDAFAPRGDLTDLDSYRRRAAELRVQAMRDNATFKPVVFGLVLALAWPVAFAATASLFHGLHSRTAAAQTSVPLTR
jgi:hypothetical protein